MTYKIHVVPHSHWDREWYFTTSRSKVYLMKDIKDVLDTLESDPEFKHFMLDAQASLLDDYLAWNKGDKKRIDTLVKQNKLIIGPWYTQSDQLVISAESIVRNLYYGINRCEDFGGYMKVAYVPDSFGQAANMPQIYKSFNLNDTLFWRGVSDDMSEKTEFTWVGDDGTEVFAAQIPNGYYIGGNIPEDEIELKAYLETDCIEKVSKRASTNNLYFPNGFDQAPIRKNLPQLIRKANEIDPKNTYVISSVEAYIKDVKDQRPNLVKLYGEFVNAKHMRIHKSIFSSRSDLKILNTQVQNYVTNILEPLLVISHRMGNDYPQEVVKDIWKLLFENAAHDSIGSCISDTANEDVYMRYKQARDLATNLTELHMRLVATSIENSNDAEITLTLFNTLPTTRKGVIETELYIPDGEFEIKDVNGNILSYSILEKVDVSDYVLAQTIRLNPSKKIYFPKEVYKAKLAIVLPNMNSLGYQQLILNLKGNSYQSLVCEDVSELENEFYQLHVNSNGSLDIFDKQNQVMYAQQALIEENGDDGDSFNYSLPRQDLLISSTSLKNANFKIYKSELLSYVDISYDMFVPKNLTQRSLGMADCSMPVQLRIKLFTNDPIIKFNVQIDNQALSHRVRVLFDSGIASKVNIADQQFGSIERPNSYDTELGLWEKDKKEWQEVPTNIEPTQSFVTLCDDTHGMAIFPNGVREYEIVKDNFTTIALTLFRTYGAMGKENLLSRPGRASGEKVILTPDAQMLGILNFSFGLYCYHTSFNESNVSLQAKIYTTPIQIYQYADFINGRLIFVQEDVIRNQAVFMDLFTLKKEQIIISAIKKHEINDGYILRFYNGNYKDTVSDILHVHGSIEEAYCVNLLEEKIDEPLRVIGNDIYLDELAHCKFISIFVKVV